MSRAASIQIVPAPKFQLPCAPKPERPSRRPIESPATAPAQLHRIPWGKPDPALAGLVCRHLVHANPAVVIPFNARTSRGLLTFLRTHLITHD